MQRVTAPRAATQRAVRSMSTKGKEIRFGSDARSKMLKGVTRLTKAVSATLGPKGRNVIIQQPFGPAKITKDGVTVAKAVEFKEPFENLGAQLVRQVANTTNEIAGDGTTTSTVLAQAIFAEGFKHVTQGRSPIEMKRGIDRAVKEVVAALNAQKRDVSTPEEMKQVATISANGDTTIGDLISKAMEKVGRDGVITTADGNKLENELETTEGMSLDRGFISPYFVTDTKTQKTELKDANLLIVKQKVTDLRVILQVLEATQLAPLLIVAEDVEGEALSALILNKLQGRVRVCAVKAPGFGDNRANILQDLATFSGGQVIDEEAGVKVTNPREALAVLGKVKKITVSKDQTILLEGAGKTEEVKARVQSIREAMELSSSDWDREKMQERMAKLQGGVAVIRVGGASDVEVGEKKDRVTDALCATRCAVQEGIVAGGGTALLYAGKSLEPLLKDTKLSEDQRLGVRIVYEALKLPLKTISENAGIDGGVVVHRVLKENSPSFGYDASKGEYVDMFQAGIVDPVKVVRAALVDAASVAGLIMTSEAAIVDATEDTKEEEKDE